MLGYNPFWCAVITGAAAAPAFEVSTWSPSTSVSYLASAGGTWTLSAGNTITSALSGPASGLTRSLKAKTAGKWYAEIRNGDGVNASAGIVGFANDSANKATAFLGQTTDMLGYSTNDRVTYGHIPKNNVQATLPLSLATGAWIGLAVDVDAGTASLVDALGTYSFGTIVPSVATRIAISCNSTSGPYTLNTGGPSSPFQFTAPPGYLPWAGIQP